MRYSLVVVAVLLLISGDADACSCNAPGPACQAAPMADAVFVADVIAVDNVTQPPYRAGEPGLSLNGRRVRVRVLEAFSGVATGELDVFTGSWDGDCGVKFELGERYLVYGGVARDGRLTTSSCSRTQPIGSADEDLRYLRWDERRDGPFSRILGVAQFWERTPDQQIISELVAGVRIVAESATARHEALTGSDGAYSISVSPGEYRITADIADPSRYVASSLGTVTIRDSRSCAYAPVGVRPNARLTGRLLHAELGAVEGAAVELRRAASPGTPQRSAQQAEVLMTDADGGFISGPLDPGRYSLRIADGTGQLLYPGVTSAAAERVVTVERGETTHLDDFTLPAGTELSVLTGQVRDSRGAPVADAHVSMFRPQPRLWFQVRTDRDGRFRLVAIRPGTFSLQVSAGQRLRPVNMDGILLGADMAPISVVLPDYVPPGR